MTSTSTLIITVPFDLLPHRRRPTHAMAQTKSKRQGKPPPKPSDSDVESNDELTQSQEASQSVSHKTIENVLRKQQEQVCLLPKTESPYSH